MTKDELIDLLAQVLNGLQVPASIGGVAALGTAYDPWRKLHEAAGFGWHDKEMYETMIRDTLGI